MKYRLSKINWLVILIVFLLAWVVGSFVDVMVHNLNPNPVYASWNLFKIFWGKV